jgi:SAM-dependent methyltransferase
MAHAFGVECHEISAAEVGDKAPVLRTDDLQGALWLPGDGKANPADLCMSLAKGARKRGVKIVEGVEVTGLTSARGRVTGVDASEKFIEHVRARSLPNVDVQVADVQQLHDRWSANAFDGAYCRWVLCFVADPQRVIDGVARSLKSGARFAIQDYYNYTAIQLAPKSEIFERVIAAVSKSWREHGGDPDVGCRLPHMLDRADFDVQHIEPIVRVDGKPVGKGKPGRLAEALRARYRDGAEEAPLRSTHSA